MYTFSAGVAEVSLQQGEDSGLVCTSDGGAVIRCSLSQTESGKAASIQCSIPGGTTLSLTAEGQVQADRIYVMDQLLLGFTMCATYLASQLCATYF